MTKLRDLKRGDLFRFVKMQDRSRKFSWTYLGKGYYCIPGVEEMYQAKGDPEVDIVTKSKGSTS